MSARFLIVDDESGVRSALSGVLRDEGYRVEAVDSGEACLDRVVRKAYDVIMLDIWLPGIDGLEASRRIWAAYEPGPIVAVSASALAHEQQAYLQAGFAGFLAKPLRFEQVCQCLATATHLHNSRLTRALVEKNAELERESARREAVEAERALAADALARADEQLDHLAREAQARWGIDGFIGQSPT